MRFRIKYVLLSWVALYLLIAFVIGRMFWPWQVEWSMAGRFMLLGGLWLFGTVAYGMEELKDYYRVES